MIETIIFDMDGVLVDSEPFWRKAKVNAVAKFGGEITEELAYQSTGLRIDEIANYWIRYCGLDPACSTDLADTILSEVIAQIKMHGQLLPGVKASLESLAQTDLKIGLASSSPLRLIEAVLETFDIGKFFSVYVSAEHLEYGKPHPQVYLNAAEKLSTKPHNCVAIEDSVNGLIAAKSAQMTAICVPEPGQETNPRFGIADIKLISLEEFSTSQEVQTLLQR
ncbi:hexitol phosphatase HxpB [Vibrio mytili]|uniref:HAD family hydrolase n=1 Tax=Vibrio mytili TaxID=50718 RepID=A0A0C3DGN3_9VIBR|nr:hexitol phosphatase HxpB [Vibrio mytili]KIN10539.1 HAD family hydrolase [Vibrio mytili]